MKRPKSRVCGLEWRQLTIGPRQLFFEMDNELVGHESSSGDWSSSSDSSSWDETDDLESGAGEPDQPNVETVCLFCPQAHATPECVLSHIQLSHDLDIV